MFLIMGISQGIKQVEYLKTILCKRCGKYGRYEVTMVYMYFSLFFIPILKWDKKFYVRTTCCGIEYELDKEVGKRLLRGENIEITDKDIFQSYNNGFNNSDFHYHTNEKTCYKCGYKTNDDFDFCPKCGNRF